MLRSSIALSLVLCGFAPSTGAQEQEIVQFGLGETSAAILGEITGRAWRDYMLGAQEGQMLSVALFPDNSVISYFNILAPSSQGGEAIYIGSSLGPHALMPLPETGDYTIRVYLMGNARDTAETAKFYLSMAIR